MLMKHEVPLPLSAIRKLFPNHSKATIYYVTCKCTAFPGETPKGRRRGSHYLPSEVAARLKRLDDALPADTLKYTIGRRTYVANELLMQECGISKNTARRWASQSKIDKSIPRDVKGGRQPDGSRAPIRRSFYVKEQIDAQNDLRETPLAKLAKPRTPTEIKKLDDEDFITIVEMESVGVPLTYAYKYWDWSPGQRRHAIKSNPLINRPIRTKAGERLIRDKNGQRYIRPEPLVRWGDIRELLHVRDNPPVPECGILVRDALPKLKAIGIKISETGLKRMINSKSITGGVIDAPRKNFVIGPMAWMQWSERDKLRPRNEQPGNRVYWRDGEDWHPWFFEGWRLAGCKSTHQLKKWIPVEHDGRGKPCPHLNGRTVRSKRIDAPNARGPSLLVCAGDDLRTIAEKLTGVRPKPPPKPARLEAAATAAQTAPPSILEVKPKRGRKVTTDDAAEYDQHAENYKRAFEATRIKIAAYAVEHGLSLQKLGLALRRLNTRRSRSAK